MKTIRSRSGLAACIFLIALALPAAAADAVFPTASRLGMVPPPGLEASKTFPGFEDNDKTAFIRLIALPQQAFAEIDKTMTNDALKKQGMAVEKRDTLKLGGRQRHPGVWCGRRRRSGCLRKWLLIAPWKPHRHGVVRDAVEVAAAYADDAVRLALRDADHADPPCRTASSSRWCRSASATPQGCGWCAWCPGRCAIHRRAEGHAGGAGAAAARASAASGGPARPATAISSRATRMSGLLPMKDVRITTSEGMDRRPGRPRGAGDRQGRTDRRRGRDRAVAAVRHRRLFADSRNRAEGPVDGSVATRFRAVRDGSSRADVRYPSRMEIGGARRSGPRVRGEVERAARQRLPRAPGQGFRSSSWAARGTLPQGSQHWYPQRERCTYCGLSLAEAADAGVAFGPPLDTATSAGRSTRSPIV